MKKIISTAALLLAFAATSFCQSFFEFYFYSDGIRYDALLYIDANDNASVRVKYYSPEFGRYVAVDQGASTTTGPRGVAITCNYVVWANTTISARGYYAPDNFFLGYNAYGSPLLFNFDNNGTYSTVYGLRQLQTYYDFTSAYNRYASN